MTCPLTQQLHITCHCVERVSKFGWYRSMVAYDGQWERVLSLVLSGSSASMQGLQEQLMELAASNIVLTQRLATVEAASTVTPLPQQVLMPSVISTRLPKQLAAFDGDRTKWVYVQSVRKCSQRSHGCLGGTRAECDRPVPLDLPIAPSDRQVNA